MKASAILRQTWLAARTALIAMTATLGVATVLIYVTQDKFVYLQNTYKPHAEDSFKPAVQHIDYRIPQGDQVAFYLPPKSGEIPARLWIVFPGNAGYVLGFRPLVEQPAFADEGVLMIDYPGYGYNAGHPSATSIQLGADAAIAALAAKLGLAPGDLLKRTGALGASLGTGIALEFAVAHPEIQRVILVSPYISLYDMAFQHVGPIATLLHHNFDNEAALRTLQQRSARPRVEIIHGDRDQIVPVWMSRRMHREFPWVSYRELPGYEHIHIVTDAAPLIAGEMAGMP